MSWRNNRVPLAVLAIFLVQISAPMVQFPVINFEDKISSRSSSISFNSGSGHDLQGDLIELDGKNWTVRGESIIDHWSVTNHGLSSGSALDMIVDSDGVGYSCSSNGSDVNLHTFHTNGTTDVKLVDSWVSGVSDDCAIAISGEQRIQIAYNHDDDLRLARLAEPNAVYSEKTWHLRTIAEDVYDSGLTINFDTESKSHILFKDLESQLSHLSFNKAYWNHTVLDDGPVGSDIEVQIDENDMFHVVYTNTQLGDIQLLRFNETEEIRQVLARNPNISDAVGMDLDSNNIEQVAYAKSDDIGNNSMSLLRSLDGKDSGRIDPNPKFLIDYDDDSEEGIVASGDLNSDGYDDLVYSDPEGNGTISIHYGSTSGPGDLADRILVGHNSESMLGTALAVGDFNCDGIDDLAASEPGNSINNSGHVFVRLGTVDGISETNWWEMNGSDEDNLGWLITNIGDVESDGCEDLAVVANKLIEEDETTPSLTKNGLVMVLKGNTTSMVVHSNITQTEFGNMFGRQVAGNADINGDGYLDLVISNTGNTDNPSGYSSVEFFMGNSSGIVPVPVKTHVVLTQGRLYGVEMEFVGDVHGDGYDDLLVSELYASTPVLHMGKVHMWAGSANGPVSNWSEIGPFANALLGTTISSAGDINEDGYDDFFMMMPKSTKTGVVELYLGSSNGPRTDTQLFAQGSAAGERVGLNMLAGMDLDGDGMGDILYSSRDLDRGADFVPVLTIMSERDWEYVDFEFEHPIVSLEMHATLRGTPTILVKLNDSSLNIMENTQDGTPSGRWVIRDIGHVNSASFGITSAGKPLILASSTEIGQDVLISMTATGNTAMEISLNSGTGLGKQMGIAQDADGNLRMGHASPDFSSIFYTVESDQTFTTSTVRSSIDLAYPIQMLIDENNKSRMVYVDNDDYMVYLSTHDSSWSEELVLNTTVGTDFDAVWNQHLMFAQVAISNNSTVLQYVEYSENTSTVSDIVSAGVDAEIELDIHGDRIVLALIDNSYLSIYERNVTGGNWSLESQTWMLGEVNNYRLAMDNGVVLYDANNTVQGIVTNTNGSWVETTSDVPDSNTPIHLSSEGDRVYMSSTNSNGEFVLSTFTISENTPQISTSFPSILTEYGVPLIFESGKISLAYSISSSDDFHTMRIITDSDKDLIPDSHDELPMLGNQWIDSDSDGFGDNPLGPLPDSCTATAGTSIYDRFGCADYDGDGWSDLTDDCVNDDGMSWWGRKGCNDFDQDGWSDNDAVYVGGDRYPTNWKQALDSDRDSFGDNHGPDCCNVTIFGEVEVSVPDLFPYNRMQWKDDDNDGYGDNESDVEFGDKCWWVQGFSWRDRLGCVDTDGDGSSDPSDFGTHREWNIEDGADKWPEDPTQWADTDADGYGDNSSDGATNPDKFPNNEAAANDTDNDGYPNNWTALENGSNRDGLFLDNCPDVAGNSTSSVDGLGAVVAYYGCTDTDGDGREDSADAFPLEPTQVADSDGDGWGDNMNGVDPDKCPYDAGVINGTLGVGCPILGLVTDTDGDGVGDDSDICDDTQAGQAVDEVGCSEYQKDDDQDFVSNAEDLCPSTPIGEVVDEVGCSESQTEVDSDGDGIFDPYDLCPDSNPELSIDENGCNLSQKDTDEDGVNDLMDECPGTELGLPVLSTGCVDESALAEDIDGDGYKGPYSYNPDTETHEGDAFPLDPTQWHDMDGDGYGDSQAPGANFSDDCPEIWGNSTMKNRYGCLDSDGDGYHDFLGDDKFPSDGTQWEDRDLDSWGDNPDGNDPDQCLNTSTAGDRTAQARANFGCADYQSDSDGDGVFDDVDACMNTEPGVEVYPSGCKREIESSSDEEEDLILGMEPLIFFAAAGGGGVVFLILLVFIISRIRGRGEFDFDDDDDDDDWYDDEDDEDDFMASVLGRNTQRNSTRNAPLQSRGPPQSAIPPRGPPQSGPSRGPPPGGQTPSRGPPGARPPTGPPMARGPTMPPRGPDPAGPPRGKKVSKKKIVDGKPVKKSRVVIDPDLFAQEELADRKAAVDWTKGALRDGESERGILMQLQTTGWSAPQSRAIIDLSKQ